MSITFSSLAVKRLFGWKQGEEDDKWIEKAIDNLVKKLKNQGGSLQELERAISQANPRTHCVTIPRSLDGRIQVCHKKGLPHVIYCRVWRWPDLQSHHELKPIDDCDFAFLKKKGDVCINPYHYMRVEPPIVAPVLVPFNPQLIAASYQPISIYLDQQQCVENSSETSSPTYSETGSEATSIAQSLSASSMVSSPPDLSPSPDPEIVAVQCEKPPYWCSIAYYELNHRVGEMFKVSQNDVVVDGFTDPSTTGDRFSLGTLSNIHRNSTIENTRRHIGKGVHLQYVNGEVIANCLSANPVFVQSQSTNCFYEFHVSAVCKILPGCTLKIFDDKDFATTLALSADEEVDTVYGLMKMCKIRLSFVIGWGTEFQRYDVSSTPCWIEIFLHGPLMWLDKVVSEIGCPDEAYDSDSN